MNASTLYCAHCGAANPDDTISCFACGQPLSDTGSPALDLLAQPPIKGRYHLLARLGAGGFGAVYRAEDTGLGNRLVAIKEMAQSGLKPAELAEATEAFQREAYLLAGLKHPNLPHIYDHFREAGRWYLVMDFIEGQTLESLLAHTPAKRLPVNDVLKIGLQLASVLGYLHANQPPIIFRDLKPANVMLTAGSHAYLIDFGIARLIKPGQAKDTLIIGTPGYLAPEGYGKAQTTPRSDIYSLGATLHHLLSGIDPSERPFFFAPLQPPVPAPLQALIAQMVKMDEKNRPASMAEVKERLQQIEDGSALAAPTAVLTAPNLAEKPPASPEQDIDPSKPLRIVPVAGQLYLPTPPPAQNRTAITRRAVAIGLGTVLAGGTIWALARTLTPKPRMTEAPVSTPMSSSTLFSTPTPPATPTPASNSSGTTVYQIYRGHIQPIMAVAWSPLDGASLASSSLDTTTQIWDTSSQLVTVTHEGMATRMVWSPDGQYIATSGGTDYKIHIWRANDGGDLISYPIQAAGDLPALAWSPTPPPNTSLLASSDDSGKIQIWDAFSGNNQIIAFGGTTNGVLALAWLPDGQHILSGSGVPNNNIYLWNALTGAMLTSFEGHTSSVTVLAVSPNGQYFASASLDNTVRVWKINSNISPIVYKGHTSLIQSVAWSPDSKRIASGSSDNTVQVWDAATGGNVFIYRGHTAPVTSVDWSAKNNHIASGGFDTTVQIWEPR